MRTNETLFELKATATSPELTAPGGRMVVARDGRSVAAAVPTAVARAFGEAPRFAAAAGEDYSWVLDATALDAPTDAFTVEALVRPEALADGATMRVVEGARMPFALTLHRGSTPELLTVRASFHLQHAPGNRSVTGWEATEAPDATKAGAWVALAAVWDGGACTVLVNGVAVARRVFKDAAWMALTGAPARAGVFVGTWVDGKRDRFHGELAALRAFGGVATRHAEATDTAANAALGVFESVHGDYGGDTGLLGVAKSPVVHQLDRAIQVFERAAVVWHRATGPRVVPAPLHLAYLDAEGAPNTVALTSLGVPMADARSQGEGASRCRVMPVEFGQIVQGPQGTVALTGATLAAYARPIELGGQQTSVSALLGLPLGPSVRAAPGVRVQRFQLTGGVIYARGDEAFEVHGLIGEHYTALGGPAGLLGMPTSDEQAIRDADGREIGRLSAFEHGNIYFKPGLGAREVHGAILAQYLREGGPAGRLGFPVTDESGAAAKIRYSGFERGVVAIQLDASWPTAQTILHAEIDMMKAQQYGYIVDSAGIEAVDRHGELFAFVCVSVNGEPRTYGGFDGLPGPRDGAKLSGDHRRAGRPEPRLCDRFPRTNNDEARRRSNDNFSKTVTMERRWRFEVRHDTVVDLKIDVWDFDASSSDDWQGCYDRRLDINNLWGLLEGERWTVVPRSDGKGDAPAHGGIADYHRVPANDHADAPGTHASYHNVALTAFHSRNQKQACNICLDYKVLTDRPAVHKAHFREQAWWHFKNFTHPKLTWDHYSASFPNVAQGSGVYEFVQNPIGSVFYEVYKGMAKKGACFGMAAEGLRALNNLGWHTEHIYTRYPELTDTTRDRILERHGAQLSAGITRLVTELLGHPSRLGADRQFNVAAEQIARHGACVISLMRVDLDTLNTSGHTVLAYDFDRATRTLTVADPNLPRDLSPTPSTITVAADGTFTSDVTINGRRYETGSQGLFAGRKVAECLMVAIPYACAATPQRRPNLVDLFGLAGGLINGLAALFFGSAFPASMETDGDALVPIPGLAGDDAEARLFLRDGRSARSPLKRLQLNLRGRAGAADEAWRVHLATGIADFSAEAAQAPTGEDVLGLELAGAGGGILSLRSADEAAKAVRLTHTVRVDPHGRPPRQVEAQLWTSRGATQRFGSEAGTGALVLEPGGARRPFSVSVVQPDQPQAAPRVLSWTEAEAPAAGEQLRVRLRDDLRGEVAQVERVTVGGAVLARFNTRFANGGPRQP